MNQAGKTISSQIPGFENAGQHSSLGEGHVIPVNVDSEDPEVAAA